MLTVSAEVVRTWYALAEARTQIDLLDRQIATNETVLELLENRFGTGQVRAVDILRQRRLVETTREQRSTAESRRRVLAHQLAVLLGRTPRTAIADSATALPALPPLPDTGVPGDLVQRRPDVRRAHFLLQAADRDLAAAVSERYPRLTLSASLTTTGSDATDLFDTWVRSLAGGLLAPLFDGGQRAAEVDRSEAVRRQRLYEYGQTVLTAFREVEDALVRERQQSLRIASLERQVQLSRQTYEQLRTEYFNGLSDYLDVLTALTDEQQLRRDLLSATRQRLEYRIALYRALAGGVSPRPDAET